MIASRSLLWPRLSPSPLFVEIDPRDRESEKIDGLRECGDWGACDGLRHPWAASLPSLPLV